MECKPLRLPKTGFVPSFIKNVPGHGSAVAACLCQQIRLRLHRTFRQERNAKGQRGKTCGPGRMIRVMYKRPVQSHERIRNIHLKPTSGLLASAHTVHKALDCLDRKLLSALDSRLSKDKQTFRNVVVTGEVGVFWAMEE